MASPRLNIAIIGAGPAGCMLGRILTRNNVVDVTIFESDESPNYRTQGGTLDLHPKTGLAAVHDAGLYEEFSAVARADGDYYLMSDKHLTPWFTMGPSKPKQGPSKMTRPEIDRYDLRRILTESLPEGTIKWGHRLQSVETDGEGDSGCRLIFKNGAEATGFDLVVGCEGTWSKVRTVLDPEMKPIYAGVSYHQLRIPNAATTAPETTRLVNNGNVFVHAKGRFLAVQQLGDGSINVAYSTAAYKDDPNWFTHAEYDTRDVEQTKAAIIKEMEADGWDTKLIDAVRLSEGVDPDKPKSCEAKPYYRIPVGRTFPHRRGVTIVGDAAHVMLPFAGEGANQALDDARKLAAAIIQSQSSGASSSSIRDDLDLRVRDFEKDMAERVTKCQQTTYDLTELIMFSPDPKIAFPDVMVTHASADLPKFLHPIAKGGIYTAWWWKNKFQFQH